MNVDSSIRILWAEAVDLQDLRDMSEQSEFLALRKQLGVDVSSLSSIAYIDFLFNFKSSRTVVIERTGWWSE